MKWSLANIRAIFKPRLIKTPLTLNQHNIFILPTRWGFGFVGLILLFMLISTNYNNNLGFMLSFLLASIGLASALQAQRNLTGLVLASGKQSTTFLGEKLLYELQIDNAIPRNRYSLILHDRTSAELKIDILKSNNKFTVELLLQPIKRGWYSPEVIVIESKFPLGLFRAWSRFKFNWQGLVYPTPAKTYKPFPLSGANTQTNTNYADDDFAGFKNYNSGDPLKLVHWKNYAKGRKLVTRIYHQYDQEQIWLDWDLTEEFNTEDKLSRLCRWLLDAEKDAINYGLRLPKLEISPDHGIKHLHACLRALALFEP